MFDYHLLYYYLFNEECKMQKKNETRKMDKEQQIEEMKKVMCEEYGKECNDCPCSDCANAMIAENLYNAGYRKVGSDAKGNLLKIQNLCIEFDEMGYEPTTLCENPEQTAKKWKSDLMCEIGLFLDESMGIKARYNELKAENERLTERLKQVLLSIDTVKEMNAMCNIDDHRKQAVKEFAEWIKDNITDIPFCNQKAYNVFCDMVNEKLKEYEK